jgi:glycosyltransferase involved in cell wall biosynthesis
VSRGEARIVVASPLPLGPGDGCTLELRVPPSTDRALALVIDLYDADDHRHPEGHLAYFVYPLDARDALRFELDVSREPNVRLAGVEPAFAWRHPDLDPTATEAIDVHVVLRDLATEEARLDRVVPWIRDEARHAAARRVLDAPPYLRAVAAPELGLAPDATVHLVAPDVHAGDAIGNLALDLARALRHHGVPVRLWASQLASALAGVVAPIEDLAAGVGPDDVILYQYSIADPALDRVLETPAAKVCFYQGVTPPELMATGDPEAAERCARGLAELPRLARFDAFLAGSRFTADELRAATGHAGEIRVCPPALNLDRFRDLEGAPLALPASGRFLLYVGRFAPHKGIDSLLDAFAAYRARDPKCDLVLAGAPAGPAYGEHLARRRAALPAEIAAQVHVVARPDDAVLKTLYETCTACVSASRHEGFGIPLVEAMGFGKPVFGLDGSAVRETVGGAGCLVPSSEPAAWASAWDAVLSDPARLDAQLAAQARRFAELRAAADGRLVWAALADAIRARRPD